MPRILEFLLEQQGEVPDRELLQQSQRRLRNEPVSGKQLIISSADDAGIRLTVVRMRLSEALRQVHPECPWIALRTGASGEGEVLFLLEGKKGKAHCFEPGRQNKPRWMSEQELREWLSAGST